MLNSSKIKKIFIAVFLVFVAACMCAFTLTACGKKTDGQEEDTVKPIFFAVISKLPKTLYTEGETFSVDGMEWSVSYEDLTTDTVAFSTATQGVTINPSRALTSADVLVEVTYGGYTLPVPVIVKKAHPDITMALVSKLPKIQYTEGETFSVEGMEWEVAYEDLSTETIKFTAETENVTFSPSGPLKPSDTSVSVTYNGYTLLTPIPITVKAKIVDCDILKNPSQTEYFEGESFKIDGLKVKFKYSDSSSETVTFTSQTNGISLNPSKFNGNSSGNTDYVYPENVEVTYNGFKFNVPVSVKYPAVTGLSIKSMPTKTRYKVGDTFNSAGLMITVSWEDGTQKNYSASSFTIPVAPFTGEDTKVTASYQDKYYKTILYLDIPVQVMDITNAIVTKLPDKTEYVAGENFDPTGMVATLSYTSGNTEEIAFKKGMEGLTLPENPLTASDNVVRIFYYSYPKDINIEILKGVYIEAENAIINSPTYGIATDAVDKNGIPNASGGKYVSELNAGDRVTFVFNSDKTGKCDIAFILASKYLKEDNNWVPVEMGNCQFNKICKFSVNGEEYNISDKIILPGGSAETSAGAMWLWFNWKEVVFKDIAVVSGMNEVVLEFIPHNIQDCSQPVFNGKFTANLDSLKVTSSTCDIEVCSYNYSAQSVDIEEADGKAALIVKGNINYSRLTDEEAAKLMQDTVILSFADKYALNLNAYSNFTVSVTETDETADERSGEFTLTANLSLFIGKGIYYIGLDGKLLNFSVTEKTVSSGKNDYKLYFAGGKPAIKVDFAGGASFGIASLTNVEIAEVDNRKAVYCLSGTYSANRFDEEEIKALLKAEYFCLKKNIYSATMQWEGEWTEYNFTACEVIVEGNKFTLKYDITALEDYHYTSYFGLNYDGNGEGKLTDLKLGSDIGDVTNVYGRNYELVSYTGHDESAYHFWGCVGVIIVTFW